MAGKVDKKRKINWTPEEAKELRAAYLDHAAEIEGKLTPYLTLQKKNDAWKDIVDRVNAQGSCVRSMVEVRKKLSDMKTNIKKRERNRRFMAGVTGGGPAPKLEDWEEKMLEVIGQTAVEGFGGGCQFDMFKWNVEQAQNETYKEEIMNEACIHVPIPQSAELPQQTQSTPISLPVDSSCLDAQVAEFPRSDFSNTRSEKTIHLQIQDPETGANSKDLKKKKKDKGDEDRGLVISLLKQQNDLLTKIYGEQQKTNAILEKQASNMYMFPI